MTRPYSAPGTHWHDLAWCALLALTAFMLGVTANYFRGQPLPWRYLTKAERLSREVAHFETKATPTAQATFISSEELRDLLATRPPVILDARAEPFYHLGHIEGALSLPREDFLAAYEKLRPQLEADKSKQLVIYCQGGECEDSELLAQALSQLGFTQLRILAGGWEAWSSR